MRLKTSVLNEIRKNDTCRHKLMQVHDKKESTILRWLRSNSPELTLTASIEVITFLLQKEFDDIIVREEHDFKPVI